MMKLGNQRGFTIVELMIATTIFSVVLLLCAYGLLEIGRTYYKGVTTTRTQEAARRILVEATESIKFNGGLVVANEAGRVHCVGNKRYSFMPNRMYTDSNPDSHALVSDEISCSTGIGPQNLNGVPTGLNSAEMLGNRMRISRFSIDSVIDSATGNPVPGLFRVTVRVVTGENDLLIDRNGDNNITAADNPVECRSQRAGSQFCSVSELTTTVQKRVQ